MVLCGCAGASLAALAAARRNEAIVTYKSLAPDVAFDLAQTALAQVPEGRLSGRRGGARPLRAATGHAARPLRRHGALDIANEQGLDRRELHASTPAISSKASRTAAQRRASPALPRVVPLVGGLVIQAGGSLLGAVGVSGAPGGDKDEACAKAGLRAVQDKLDF